MTQPRPWDYDSLNDRLVAAVVAVGALEQMKYRMDLDYGRTNNWGGKPYVLGLDHRGIRRKEKDDRVAVMEAQIGAAKHFGWTLSNHDPSVKSADHCIHMWRSEDAQDWIVAGETPLHDGVIPVGMQDFLRVLEIDPSTLKIKGTYAVLEKVSRGEAVIDAAFERALKLLITGD